jgi:phenylacetate-CoA ligase
MTQLPPLPASRAEIARIQRERKLVAFEQAKRAPFYAGKLDHVDARKLDDPDEWRKIPILDKDMLRSIPDTAFYRDFCLSPHEGICEYWRSGGATGAPLFYPRSFTDMRYALVSFARGLDCLGLKRGETAHISFPLGIHPVGQVFGRCAEQIGVGALWAGAGTTTPSQLQLDLIRRLKPSAWLGMSSYGLHLANLAEATGFDLSSCAIKTVVCSAEPLSDAKRSKLERSWGARVRDTFGMTEAGLMGAEDDTGQGFRVWSDFYFTEILDPQTWRPVPEGQPGCLVVTPLWTNTVTPFLRWSSGDIVIAREADDRSGPYSVFPVLKHTQRTTGFFKIRGVNINHAEFEDLMFALEEITDFKAEAVASAGLDGLRLSVELKRGCDSSTAITTIAQRTKSVFEVTPEIVVLDPGFLAKEFESNVKAPRFVDIRS